MKIADADNNKLFRTIDSLIKVKRVPLLPTHSSSKELVQRFSDFFQSKILKLMDNLRSSYQTSKDMSVVINSAPCPSSFTESAEVSGGYKKMNLSRNQNLSRAALTLYQLVS